MQNTQKFGKFLGRDFSDMNITFEQQLEKLETSEEAKVIRIGKTEEEKRTASETAYESF